MRLHVFRERSCGSCTACCTVLGVQSLGKPPRTRCRFETVSDGCSAYDARPEDCRRYNCLWIQGLFADGDRPDKTGILIMLATEKRSQFVVHELRPGAIREQEETLQSLRDPLLLPYNEAQPCG